MDCFKIFALFLSQWCPSQKAELRSHRSDLTRAASTQVRAEIYVPVPADPGLHYQPQEAEGPQR